MKSIRIFAILFLALLLSCISTERGLTETKKLQTDDARRATAPNSAVAADKWAIDCAASITIRSSLDTGRSKLVSLQAAVPAPFAQVYRYEADEAMSLDLVRPDSHTRIKTTADGCEGSDMAVAEMPDGFVYIWNAYTDLEYTLRDSSGNAIRKVSKLTEHSEWDDTYDLSPAVAVAPNGNIGVIWYRHIDAYRSYESYNIYYAVLEPSGNFVVSPTNLTNEEPCWYYNGCNAPLFLEPRITTTDDNHFIWTLANIRFEQT